MTSLQHELVPFSYTVNTQAHQFPHTWWHSCLVLNKRMLRRGSLGLHHIPASFRRLELRFVTMTSSSSSSRSSQDPARCSTGYGCYVASSCVVLLCSIGAYRHKHCGRSRDLKFMQNWKDFSQGAKGLFTDLFRVEPEERLWPTRIRYHAPQTATVQFRPTFNTKLRHFQNASDCWIGFTSFSLGCFQSGLRLDDDFVK